MWAPLSSLVVHENREHLGAIRAIKSGRKIENKRDACAQEGRRAANGTTFVDY